MKLQVGMVTPVGSKTPSKPLLFGVSPHPFDLTEEYVAIVGGAIGLGVLVGDRVLVVLHALTSE